MNKIFIATITDSRDVYQRVFSCAEKAICSCILAANTAGFNMKRADRYERKLQILNGGIGKAITLRFTGDFHVMIECLKIE